MENLLPPFIKTLEKITSLKLNQDLWVSVKCSVMESKVLKDGSIREMGVGYWKSRETGSINFYSSVSSSIHLDFKAMNLSIMIKEEGKYQLIEFLKQSLLKCMDKHFYKFKNSQLIGVNQSAINERGRLQYDKFVKCEYPLNSQPMTIRNENNTRMINSCELFFDNQHYIDLLPEELKILIDHISNINLLTFTQNAINSIGWKIQQFNRIHTVGIKEYRMKIKLLQTMDKEEMIGMAKGLDLDTSEMNDLTERELRTALMDFFKNEIKRLNEGN